jgi:hypothetical protein
MGRFLDWLLTLLARFVGERGFGPEKNEGDSDARDS